MFGWTLIRKSELRQLEESRVVASGVVQCHRWFSGWEDLDIIWDYLLSFQVSGGIHEAREAYAKARGTDCYGKPLAQPSGVSGAFDAEPKDGGKG